MIKRGKSINGHLLSIAMIVFMLVTFSVGYKAIKNVKETISHRNIQIEEIF